MPLKRMSEFKRDDYIYQSPDGDACEITIVQTEDRKYVEIKRGEEEVQWDVEMLLDVADAVRHVTQKPTKSSKPHQLKKPSIVDHREDESDESEEVKSPSDTIQESVDESMGQIDTTVAPVQSFSPEAVAADIARRKEQQAKPPPESAKVKKTGKVQPKDLF